MLEKLNFCYVTDNNEDNINLLYKSLSSLFKYYTNNISVYVVCIDNESFNILNNYKDHNINIIYLDKHKADELPFPTNAMNTYLGYGSMIRWFIPFVVDCDYMYYVDTDILFIDNIYEQLIDVDTSILYKAYKSKGHTWKDFKPAKINAGFMFMNNKLYKKLNVFNNVKQFYIDHKDTIKFLNQSVYEYLIDNLYKDICIIDECKNINSGRFEDGYYINIYHDAGPGKYEFNLMYDIICKNKTKELYQYINKETETVNYLCLNYWYTGILENVLEK